PSSHFCFYILFLLFSPSLNPTHAISLQIPRVAAEYSSSKSDSDYEFGDYRGKWCIDDHGFVYAIGEVYNPSPTACPCTCTVDGPVCVRPKCPRVHPRCTRIRYKACCPVCEAVAKVCVYGGKTYRLLEEFRLSRCERCRCEANREVYCSISDCPAPHCVDPSFEPKQCCPVCKSGKDHFIPFSVGCVLTGRWWWLRHHTHRCGNGPIILTCGQRRRH
uniref:VWFC domain-containing protein n=1 Tax=Gadus morhua TaxID=8049 RepID=A0A8C4YX41_GADMO